MKRDSKEDSCDCSIFDLLVRAGFFTDEELAEREKARTEPPKVIARPQPHREILEFHRELEKVFMICRTKKRTTDEVMRF